jgi:hypothetical protein
MQVICVGGVRRWCEYLVEDRFIFEAFYQSAQKLRPLCVGSRPIQEDRYWHVRGAFKTDDINGQCMSMAAKTAAASDTTAVEGANVLDLDNIEFDQDARQVLQSNSELTGNQKMLGVALASFTEIDTLDWACQQNGRVYLA